MINQTDISAKTAGSLAIDAKSLNSLKLAAKENSPEAVRATAKQFEAMLMNMMLKSMRDASPQDGVFDNEQSRTYTSMLDQQLSQTLAGKGMGLTDVLTRQLSKLSGKPDPSTDGSESIKPGDALKLMNESGLGEQTVLGNKPGLTDQINASAAYQSIADATEDDGQAANKQTLNANAADHVKDFQNVMMAAAQQASELSGIPAHYMVGQAALESGWGKHQIKGRDGAPSNNLFGIKATPGWQGKVVESVTTEYVHGQPQRRVEKFRAYDTYADSFKDFANLIRNNPRYDNVMNSTDHAGQYALALQKAGYATDPNYANKLMRVIHMTATV